MRAVLLASLFIPVEVPDTSWLKGSKVFARAQDGPEGNLDNVFFSKGKRGVVRLSKDKIEGSRQPKRSKVESRFAKLGMSEVPTLTYPLDLLEDDDDPTTMTYANKWLASRLGAKKLFEDNLKCPYTKVFLSRVDYCPRASARRFLSECGTDFYFAKENDDTIAFSAIRREDWEPFITDLHPQVLKNLETVCPKKGLPLLKMQLRLKGDEIKSEIGGWQDLFDQSSSILDQSSSILDQSSSSLDRSLFDLSEWYEKSNSSLPKCVVLDRSLSQQLRHGSDFVTFFDPYTNQISYKSITQLTNVDFIGVPHSTTRDRERVGQIRHLASITGADRFMKMAAEDPNKFVFLPQKIEDHVTCSETNSDVVVESFLSVHGSDFYVKEIPLGYDQKAVIFSPTWLPGMKPFISTVQKEQLKQWLKMFGPGRFTSGLQRQLKLIEENPRRRE